MSASRWRPGQGARGLELGDVDVTNAGSSVVAKHKNQLRIVTSASGNHSIWLSRAAPIRTFGGTMLSYDAIATPSSRPTTTSTVGPSQLSASLSGLANGVPHSVKVVEVVADGRGRAHPAAQRTDPVGAPR